MIRLKDGEQILQKKSHGQLVHVSDFINEETGCLFIPNPDGTISDENDAHKIIYPGSTGDPWWDTKQLLDQMVSWYDLPSFLSCLFPPLSVPHPISVTFQLHPTSSACLPLMSACLPPPPLQLRGVLMQLCYVRAWTSLRLTSDLLGPDPCAKGYHLYTSYNLSDPFFIINNG